MKIEIKSMTLQNFKKIRSQEIIFSHNMIISGANKVGKSTIYDAYLWVIFGTTSKKNATVQPLDVNNDVIHYNDTSVTIVLNYNDERDVKIQRILTENWKDKGTTEEKLQSVKQTRLINDVPLSQASFNAKLEELCPLNKWLVLSNINIFMSYKVEDRRKMLMSLAGNINEEELMKTYPLVYKGAVTEKKELSDMLKQQNTTKKKAEEELVLIPEKIKAQEALMVKVDFETLRKQKETLDIELSAIDAKLEGTSEKNPAMDIYLQDLQEHNEKTVQAQKEWQDKKIKTIDDLTKEISSVSTILQDKRNQLNADIETYENNKIILAENTIKFNNKIKEWKDVNEKEFDYQQTDVCPVCGRPYTDDMKAAEYDNAVAEFNKNKSDQLTSLQTEASVINQQIVVIRGNINTFEKITKAQYEKDISNAQTAYDDLIKKRNDVQKLTWEFSQEKATLDNELSKIEASKPVIKIDASVEESKQRKQTLLAQRDNLITQIAGEEVNKHIDSEKKKLDKRSKELAQTIAECGEVIRQIKEYKKAKITLVEEKVNSFFSFVRWKFYEQNKTNDDEKDVCKAIDVDGIDYDNTNDGTVINIGVDIINGISRALNIFVPLFVDRKESAEYIVPVEQQTIFLQCVYGQPLEIKEI